MPYLQHVRGARGVFQFLTAAGDGTGSHAATGNMSGESAAVWMLAPAAGERFLVERLHIAIEDNGAWGFGGYGALPALANGLVFDVAEDGGRVLDFTAGHPVTTLAQLACVTGIDVKLLKLGGATLAVVRWTLRDGLGGPLLLEGSRRDALRIHLRDDFTGLDGHTFLAQGRRVT